jgi:DNA-binding transcriptional MerR regulator
MMQIGELTKQVSVSVQTIRFYERRKLLPAPARTESGYRQYGAEEFKRLNLIRQEKTLGFSLDEIRDGDDNVSATRSPRPARWLSSAIVLVAAIVVYSGALSDLKAQTANAVQVKISRRTQQPARKYWEPQRPDRRSGSPLKSCGYKSFSRNEPLASHQGIA